MYWFCLKALAPYLEEGSQITLLLRNGKKDFPRTMVCRFIVREKKLEVEGGSLSFSSREFVNAEESADW